MCTLKKIEKNYGHEDGMSTADIIFVYYGCNYYTVRDVILLK